MGTISIHHGRYIIRQPAKHLPIAYPPPYLSITDKNASLQAVTTDLPPHSPAPAVPGGDDKCSCAALKPRQQDRCSEDKLATRSKTIAIKKPKFVLPYGEYEINLGQQPDNNHILIMPEPPIINPTSQVESRSWPPQICRVSGGNAQYINYSSDEPIHHQNNVHFRAIQVEEIQFEHALAAGDDQLHQPVDINLGSAALSDYNDVLSDVKVNRSIMSTDQSKRLDDIFSENIRAFDEDLTDGFNDENDPYIYLYT